MAQRPLLHLTFGTGWSCFAGEPLGANFACKERLGSCVQVADIAEGGAGAGTWLAQEQGSWVLLVRLHLATDLTAFLLLKPHEADTASKPSRAVLVFTLVSFVNPGASLWTLVGVTLPLLRGFALSGSWL